MKISQYKLSRQYKWRLRQKKLGNCVMCGRKAVTREHCQRHREIINEISLRRYYKLLETRT